MENEFRQIMSDQTDEELIKIVTAEREKYQPQAIEAAESEIGKRNIDKSHFEQIQKKVTTETEQRRKVDAGVVSSGVRFLHYIIDFIIAYLLILIVLMIIGLFINSNSNSATGAIFTLIIMFGTFFAYYAVMEIKFQKTIGKFITKTKVVKIDGNRPTVSEIITRTLCRLIPFDGISYLFVKNGLHDYLSKTKVIKDSVE